MTYDIVSEFLYHTNCPKCGSVDNLGVYTDHVWCFGCRFYENRKSINPRLVENLHKKNKNNDSVSLPSDFDYHIPAGPLTWLTNYGITAQEINKHRMGWSNEKQLLIFPVYDPNGNLLMWVGRYFGDNPDHPKYITRGAKDVLHILGENGIIILVEDLISAIKIARKYRAMPIWGSNIPLGTFIRLHSVTDEFAIWLDHDMYKEAVRAANRASQWFRRIYVIDTPLDPKCYSNTELETIIGVEIS